MLRKKTENSEENRANLKAFNTFQEEYKVMMEDLLKQVSTRDEVISNLTTNMDVKEKRHREFRFVFGNIGQLEDKLKKMEKLYIEKLTSCFEHYSRTMNNVSKENKRIGLVTSRLKDDQISNTKASATLGEA